MALIEGKYCQVRIEEDGSNFDINPSDQNQPRLLNNHLHIKGSYSNGRRFRFVPVFSRPPRISKGKEWPVDVSSFQGLHSPTGLHWQVLFACLPDKPLLLWRLKLSNRSDAPLFIDEISLLESAQRCAQNVDFPQRANGDDLAFFTNGWQSWSHTGAYPAKGSMRRSNLGILQEPMVINMGTPTYRSAGRFSSDFFGVLGDRHSRNGFLLGFLSQKDHFGSLTVDLRGAPAVRLWANGDHARLDPGMSIRTDWAVWQPVQLDDPEPLAPYLETVADVHKVKALPPAPAGWCSWYYYYEDISSKIIHENLAQIKGIGEKLPLDLVQIDDGFEAAVGDWLEFKPEFHRGVAPLALEIKSAGLIPGLWLAPFILHPRSRLAGEHPDWLLRRRNGKLSRPGFVWNSLGAALDLTVPDALEYACQVLDVAVRQWGFPYLKLDFLYAAALKGQYHDPTRTRAQVLRGGMEALRRTVGENTLLVGCGAPLGSVLGLVQTMRIGADVAPSWKPSYFGISLPIRNEPHMPSARNSIQNILTRAPLHRRWWVNDPDCLLVRPDSKLTLDEVRSLATAIGLTGGSVLLSDEMQSLPEDRLEIAAALLPIIEDRVQILDWMDSQTPQKLRLDLQGAAGDWTLLAFFNWYDSNVNIALSAEDFRLLDQDYWIRSFWDNEVWMAEKDASLFSGKLVPHAPLVLALRPYRAEQPCYLGSSLHISQGREVAGWKAAARGVSLDISPGRQAQAMFDLYLPKSPAKAELDGQSVSWQVIETGAHSIYRFKLDIADKAELKITFT